MKNWSRLLFVLFVSIGALAALLFSLDRYAMPTVAHAAEATTGQAITVTILHTNDVHGHVDEWSGYGGTFGGFARLATSIAEFRATRDNVLLLDAGDQFQGTLFYNLFKSDVITTMMNALGYDAMAIGNHEFDDGPAELARLIDGVNFSVLGANIDASADSHLAGKIQPSTIITLSGEAVGIIGLTTPSAKYNSSPGDDVIFNDLSDSLQTAVSDLTSQGVNKIIAVTHIGYDNDIALAQQVSGVDVFVGGHSHSYLYTPPDGAAGPYPTVATAPDNNPVLIVSANEWAKYLGHLEVGFDISGTVSSYSGNPILMSEAITKDSGIDALLVPYRDQVELLKNTIVGTSTVEMPISVDGYRICRFRECRLGNLVVDAMLWKANSTNSTVTYQIALVNSGGLRAPLDSGPISVGEIKEVEPFGNTIATFEITGTHIIAALEHGLGAVLPLAGADGRFPQVAGMRYSWSLNEPIGSRLLSVDILSGTTYVPLDESAVYGVVTNGYMRGGGDGYDMLAEFAINPYDHGDSLSESLQEYIEMLEQVTPALEGRIRARDDIAVDPLFIKQQVLVGSSDRFTNSLTLYNTGVVTRAWQITQATSTVWLTTTTWSGQLAPRGVLITGTVVITVPAFSTLDFVLAPNSLSAGVYSTVLFVSSDDPDSPVVQVPVTLTVQELPKVFLPIVCRY
ncbi:MAG: multifunctional 2',3'-cyclic-nucleotide 2'-phosphodiesterase/5'-nucleotidase/3'-nucleotidase [Aestuariibacter sp.]|nr:multifunctional 2',3'-cyclic-nucleotide 2'-phosphodiesterase/5'-nucleotidase/3'-nucleotidase [Aestuariibacter sp.]